MRKVYALGDGHNTRGARCSSRGKTSCTLRRTSLWNFVHQQTQLHGEPAHGHDLVMLLDSIAKIPTYLAPLRSIVVIVFVIVVPSPLPRARFTSAVRC